MATETKRPAGRDRSVRPTARAMGPVNRGTQTACRARSELLFGVWTPLTHVHGAGPACNAGSTYGVSTFRATRTSDVRFGTASQLCPPRPKGWIMQKHTKGECRYEFGREIQSATEPGWFPDSHRHAPMRNERAQGRKVVAPCGADQVSGSDHRYCCRHHPGGQRQPAS
jgi:hypothetical protein